MLGTDTATLNRRPAVPALLSGGSSLPACNRVLRGGFGTIHEQNVPVPSAERSQSAIDSIVNQS
jgi:hypothetical protein